jgi:hypothetical protein
MLRGLSFGRDLGYGVRLLACARHPIPHDPKSMIGHCRLQCALPTFGRERCNIACGGGVAYWASSALGDTGLRRLGVIFGFAGFEGFRGFAAFFDLRADYLEGAVGEEFDDFGGGGLGVFVLAVVDDVVDACADLGGDVLKGAVEGLAAEVG